MRSGQSSKGQMQMPMQPQGRMPTLDMKVPETQQLSVPRTNLPDSRQGIETPVRKLDLDGLIKTARENNPTLVQAHAQTLGEDGKAKEAGLWYNPVFSYDGSLIGVKSEGDALRAHTAGEFEGLNIQQRFVTAHKLGLSREKYQAREAAAQAEENVQALRVLNDVRIRYYQTLSSAQLADISHEIFKTAQDHWLTTKEQFNEGQASQVDYHLANAELERSRLQYALAQNNYRMHLGRLAAVGGNDLSSTEIVGELGSAPGSIQVIDYEKGLGKSAREKSRAGRSTREIEVR